MTIMEKNVSQKIRGTRKALANLQAETEKMIQKRKSKVRTSPKERRAPCRRQELARTPPTNPTIFSLREEGLSVPGESVQEQWSLKRILLGRSFSSVRNHEVQEWL